MHQQCHPNTHFDDHYVHLEMACFNQGALFQLRFLPVVLILRVPGREGRINERPYLDIAEEADDAAEAIRTKFADKPFAFFGHR